MYMWIMIVMDDNALDITYNWMLHDVIFVSLYGMSYENLVVPLSFHGIWAIEFLNPIDSFWATKLLPTLFSVTRH